MSLLIVLLVVLLLCGGGWGWYSTRDGGPWYAWSPVVGILVVLLLLHLLGLF